MSAINVAYTRTAPRRQFLAVVPHSQARQTFAAAPLLARSHPHIHPPTHPHLSMARFCILVRSSKPYGLHTTPSRSVGLRRRLGCQSLQSRSTLTTGCPLTHPHNIQRHTQLYPDMARMRRTSSLLATTLMVVVSVLSLLASAGALSTCQSGPQDTTCITQDLCSGVSTCCCKW